MSAVPGKTALITGANAGIGKEVARQLALRPEIARIYLACRNAERASTAKAELGNERDDRQVWHCEVSLWLRPRGGRRLCTEPLLSSGCYPILHHAFRVIGKAPCKHESASTQLEISRRPTKSWAVAQRGYAMQALSQLSYGPANLNLDGAG